MEKLTELVQIQTRGEFRALSERAERENRHGLESIPADSPLWDAWEQIKAFYPGSTAGWDAEPPLMWAHVLSDLTFEQIGQGVKNLIHHHDSRGRNDFPPNAGQFRDLCLTNFDWERQCHKVFETENLLEDKTAHERRCSEGLERIRKIREEAGL